MGTDSGHCEPSATGYKSSSHTEHRGSILSQ